MAVVAGAAGGDGGDGGGGDGVVVMVVVMVALVMVVMMVMVVMNACRVRCCVNIIHANPHMLELGNTLQRSGSLSPGGAKQSCDTRTRRLASPG